MFHNKYNSNFQFSIHKNHLLELIDFHYQLNLLIHLYIIILILKYK